ncbi:DUF4229 domain-containing protein [Georgenia muralis]|uniref:Uncharacterized protein DUF4229 n=1 Tax=Georgenia muralis TaxID=154117 RepID=A0A3N5A6V6_9MICO|nr:DUF4229 domain-containing protein [Georgenia muralis]RPF27441.1 uncharacterized protein DUF4229 [Georgenia muralis]
MRLVVYSLLRLLMVLAAAGVLYLVGLRSWALWAAAIVVAALVSYVVLGRQRAAAAAVLAAHDPTRGATDRLARAGESDAAYEDSVLDAEPPVTPER